MVLKKLRAARFAWCMRAGVVLAALLSATVAHADDLDPATVHIVGSSGFEIQHTRLLQSNATTLWTTICVSPCTTLGTTGGYYRAGESGRFIFGPRRTEFTLRVDPPPGRINYPILITGSALFVTGLPFFVVGLGYMSSPDSRVKRHPREALVPLRRP